jgi:hypothetical protein
MLVPLFPYTTRDAAPSVRPAPTPAASGTRRTAARARSNGVSSGGAVERCSIVCLSVAKADPPRP